MHEIDPDDDEIMTFRFRGRLVGQCRKSNYNIVGVVMPDLPSVVNNAMIIFTKGDTPESVEKKVKVIRMAYEYARCNVANKLAEGTSLSDIISDFPDMQEFEKQGFTADMLVPFRMFLWHIKASIAQNTFAMMVAQKKIDEAMKIRKLIVDELITDIETLPDELRDQIIEGIDHVNTEGNPALQEAIDKAKNALKNKQKSDKNISKDNTEESEQK